MRSARLRQAITDSKKNFGAENTPQMFDVLEQMLDRRFGNKLAPIVSGILKRSPQRVMDIGCGYGALSLYLATKKIDVIGIDLKEDALQVAQNLAQKAHLLNITFKKMYACAISLTEFDLAVSTDFFEHLPVDIQIQHLKSVHKALMPKGVYIIRSPHNLNVRQQNHPEHIGLPSFVSLRNQALEAGFKLCFNIAHTTILAPFSYQIFLEHWIASSGWSPQAKYKALQKFGMANVLACLQKV